MLEPRRLDLPATSSVSSEMSRTGLDEFELRSRWDQVKHVWREVPRHQRRWRCAPEFAEAVSEWRPDRSLILLGFTGTGKTTACVRLVERLLRAAVRLGGDHIALARSIVFTDADELTRAGGSSEHDAELLRRVRTARILVLDDVASPSKTMQEVLRARLRRGVPTVLTSGVSTIEDLARAMGGNAVLRHVHDATGEPADIYIARSMP